MKKSPPSLMKLDDSPVHEFFRLFIQVLILDCSLELLPTDFVFAV